MRNLLLLLSLFASPANATISFDDLRALVLKRDFDATDAALIAAHTEYTAAHTPDAERALYNVFALTDPVVGEFVLDWARDQPGNPRALTAKGWNLYAWGWTLRGERTVQNTSAVALEALATRHRVALPLFKQATELQPDLIPASDGLLRLTATLGNKSIIPLELERIMTSQPNRGSLMRAMVSLAPQWNGRPEQVNLLCDRYAPKITDIKDYTPEVCRIDAVYYADFWYGDQRAAAHQLLMFTPNPVLDYAREADILAGLMTQEETIAALQAIKSKRALTLKEAEKLDFTLMDFNRTLPQDAQYPEYKAAQQRDIALGDAALLRDPFNPDLLHHYIQVRSDAVYNLERPISPAEKADMIKRLHTVLKVVPTSPELWTDLAQLTLQSNDLDSIARAEPYFHNAIYYGRFGTRQFSDAVRPKVAMVLDYKNYMHAADISGLTPEQLAKLDEIVNCPLAEQLSILGVVCQNTNTPANQCAEGAVTNEVVIQRLRDRIDAGACGPLFGQSLDTLYEKATKVDF